MSESDREKRRALRSPIEVSATCTEGAGGFRGTTRNLTPEGLFLETDHALSPGARLELAIALPDGGEPARVAGRVAHRSKLHEDGPSGLGIELVGIDGPVRDRLVASIEAFWDEPSALAG